MFLLSKYRTEIKKDIINRKEYILMNETQKQIILTGDRPTGRLHLGHYVGSLKRRAPMTRR